MGVTKPNLLSRDHPALQNCFDQIALCAEDSLRGSSDNTKALGTVGRGDTGGRKGQEYLGSQN